MPWICLAPRLILRKTWTCLVFLSLTPKWRNWITLDETIVFVVCVWIQGRWYQQQILKLDTCVFLMYVQNNYMFVISYTVSRVPYPVSPPPLLLKWNGIINLLTIFLIRCYNIHKYKRFTTELNTLRSYLITKDTLTTYHVHEFVISL